MLANLRLQHFRSYSDDAFEFSQGVNIIVGPNASGKTNLLEAVLVLALGNSYRAKDIELVEFEESWARLDANLVEGGLRTMKITTGPVPTKSYEFSGKEFKRLSLTHTLPLVLFEPNHLQLLSGGPERRRTYLDDLLEQTQAGYGSLRRQYKRTLAQRNALLKQVHSGLQTQLFPWNVRLSQLGGQIARARNELTYQAQESLPKLYKELSRTRTQVAVEYVSQWPPESYETHMLHRLEASLDLDITRGFTTSGPHRDDMTVLFNGHLAQESASRGEARTLVLGLKIIELQTIAKAREITPLLLLDDVFSELDGARRHALTEHISRYQTFITTTDADVVIQHFGNLATLIPVEGRTEI
jgi:DNA replication and repair protein RecF